MNSINPAKQGKPINSSNSKSTKATKNRYKFDRKMPQQTTHTNGYSNGHNSKYDMEDGQSFLFTSESVGEGHPGKYLTYYIIADI